MTTNPLFVESVSVLKSKLRLSAIPDGKDAEAILDEVILVVRTKLLQRLGVTIVNSLLAIVFTPNPVTQEESLRALANSTEVQWIYYELALRLPVLLMDGIGARHVWNEEGTFRHADGRDLERLRSKMWNDIQENIQVLLGLGVQDDQGWRVSDIGPDTDPARPADSIRPLNVHL